MEAQLNTLMSGAIDLHIHATYEGELPRRQNMYEVATEAARAGMRALVFKSRHTNTVDTARLVNSMVDGVEVFGGIVLDYAVGGLNPLAVKSSLNMGGKIVWMPNYDSAWTLKKVEADTSGGTKIYEKLLDASRKLKPISILEGGLEGNRLLPVTKEIIDLAVQSDAIIDTSHLSPKESLILTTEACKQGSNKVLITHANSDLIGLTIAEQKVLAREGAYLMYCYAQCMPSPWKISNRLSDTIQMIKAVGAAHCVLSTDFGLFNYAPPVEGMRMFIASLLMGGIKEQDIEIMVKNNPAKLLGLKI